MAKTKLEASEKQRKATQKQEAKEQRRIERIAQAAVKMQESAFMREFNEFLEKRNMIDMAVGVAVGGALTTAAKSLVDDIIMPIVGLLIGGVDFSQLAIDIPNIFGLKTGAHIAYGNFLQTLVNFLVIAVVLFLVVRFVNAMGCRREELLKKAEQQAKDEERTRKAETNKSAKKSDKK